MIDENLITQEVLDNTLKKEIYHEVKVISDSKMGKVRIVYDVSSDKLIMMASDDLSTHNIVHRRQVYGKGENLNAISSHYFGQTGHIIPNHFIKNLAPNTWLVQKADPILIEMIYRQYLTGSGWKAYVGENGPEQGMKFCGVNLRPGYRKNEKLDELIFTPTTKGLVKNFPISEFEDVDKNEDDYPITVDIIRRNYKMFGLRRSEDIDIIMEAGLELYSFIHSDLESRGQLLADTKWEFGYFPDGTIGLIDECVTPDSSRFWGKRKYVFNPDKNEFVAVQEDKQPFRNYIEDLGIDRNKTELAKHWMDDKVLRDGVIRYCNIRETITGTQTEITTEPRKEVILEALASEGYLR